MVLLEMVHYLLSEFIIRTRNTIIVIFGGSPTANGASCVHKRKVGESNAYRCYPYAASNRAATPMADLPCPVNGSTRKLSSLPFVTCFSTERKARDSNPKRLFTVTRFQDVLLILPDAFQNFLPKFRTGTAAPPDASCGPRNDGPASRYCPATYVRSHDAHEQYPQYEDSHAASLRTDTGTPDSDNTT